ncbi:Ppx/GppA phosphatase family protein [Qaidamihabitans albus]|uniref:Ppx/GppA phosphatase family protein n=1 Tax=Qaidamihabitans albus TaxID=2795733 RepID=UPI0027DE09EB|nr:exopolyphosphatase [Qaidamihabitans albus]
MAETATTVGVLDVGCFSARLLVVRSGGSLLDPVFSHKSRLRLDRSLDASGRIGREGIDSIIAAVAEAGRVAARRGVDHVFPLATSSIRDARNATEVVERVRRETGIELRFLSGRREAELSYLAARRWYGASAGPLVVLDIGGGTVELAAGDGEQAAFARSLRLGAREMTRTWLDAEVPSGERIAALRGHALNRVRAALDGDEQVLRGFRTVGCSKVLRQLARLAGARPHKDGAARHLHVEDLRTWIPRLAVLPASRRSELPGISRSRARQALAGAVVAEALLTVVEGPAEICPWSTTQGLLLSLLDGPGQHCSAQRSVA